MTKQRSEAHTALAQSINEHVAATANLNDARSAASKAAEHVWGVRAWLEELKTTNVALASSDAVICGLASGSLDVLELDRPRAESRAKIQAAEQELAAWQSARKVAEEAVPVRERAVENAQRKLRDAAIAVIRESAPVTQLADELEELQARVIEMRLSLKFLLLRDAISDDDTRQRVEHLLNVQIPASHYTPSECVNHSMTQQWEAVLTTLMTDPDAAIPGEHGA